MERQIGEVFDFKGIKLKVKSVDKSICDGCYFNSFTYPCWYITGIGVTGGCHELARSDKKSVIFVKVEEEES